MHIYIPWLSEVNRSADVATKDADFFLSWLGTSAVRAYTSIIIYVHHGKIIHTYLYIHTYIHTYIIHTYLGDM